jgi:hypothetical protein
MTLNKAVQNVILLTPVDCFIFIQSHNHYKGLCITFQVLHFSSMYFIPFIYNIEGILLLVPTYVL